MLEAVIAGAAAALIGMASGQALVLASGRYRLARRVGALEKSVPELISRSEVQEAFARVAQVEAQRQAASMQQMRATSAFGGVSQQPAMATGNRADFNTVINAQLNSLNERLEQINREFGVR